MQKKFTGKNHRSLDDIADDIHKLQRNNVFEVGELLLKANAACEHGDWYDWLEDNFEWSEDTAENYMNAAKLPRSVRDLKLAKTTLYNLTDEDDKHLPAIIEALAKHATEKQLKPKEADEIILLARLRHEYGDLPEATLRALNEVKLEYGGGDDDNDDEDARDLRKLHKKIAKALKKEKPVTKEAADKIIEDNRKKKQQSEEPRDPAHEQFLDEAEPPLPDAELLPEPSPASASSASPQNKLEAAQARIAEPEAEHAHDLAKQLQAAKIKIAELEADITKLKAAHELQIEKYKAEIGALRAALAKVNETLGEARSLCAHFKQNRKGIVGKIDRAKDAADAALKAHAPSPAGNGNGKYDAAWPKAMSLPADPQPTLKEKPPTDTSTTVPTDAVASADPIVASADPPAATEAANDDGLDVPQFLAEAARQRRA
jgi:hypothetical protein